MDVLLHLLKMPPVVCDRLMSQVEMTNPSTMTTPAVAISASIPPQQVKQEHWYMDRNDLLGRYPLDTRMTTRLRYNMEDGRGRGDEYEDDTSWNTAG